MQSNEKLNPPILSYFKGELKLKIVNLEQGHHGRKASDAKNLVDLAESLNLTILVKALEETGLDSVIDHEGKKC